MKPQGWRGVVKLLAGPLCATLTKFLNVSHKSKHATLGHWYSTARVSKRLTYETAACLRARYCTNLTCSDLNKCPKNLVNALVSGLTTYLWNTYAILMGAMLNRARQHWDTRRYGTGGGSDRAPVEALSPPAPGRYRSRYRTNVTWLDLV